MKLLLCPRGAIILTVMFLISAGRPLSAQEAGDEIVIGTYDKLYSKILNEERTLLIHLPANYEKASVFYPVLYLLYGNHVTTYFAEAVAILDRLGQDGRVPEMILVGITNTDRYRDLLPQSADGSPTGIDDFLRFFEEEFVPYIDKTYRTKDYRVIMGPQAGANFATYALFKKPDLFDAAIINSPFRWKEGRELLLETAKSFLQNHTSFKKFLYITYEDSDPYAVEAIPYVRAFAELGKAYGVADFHVVLNFIEGNDEFLQPLGLRTGLKSLFKAYPFPHHLDFDNLAEILAYYQDLSGKYGFDVNTPAHVLSRQSDILMEKGKIDKAVEVLTYMRDNYPNAADAYWRLGNLSLNAGELEDARDQYRKILDILGDDVALIRSRLEMVEKRIAGSAAYAVEKEIRRTGIAAGLQKFRELRGQEQPTLYFDEREFNELGYRLLRNRKIEEAIAIFKLNSEMYPDSANVYDSLGEAYMTGGRNELAFQNYEKSLALDPKNENARKMLKKLKK